MTTRMESLRRCRCPGREGRLDWHYAWWCGNNATQEDAKCDTCRDGCEWGVLTPEQVLVRDGLTDGSDVGLTGGGQV